MVQRRDACQSRTEGQTTTIEVLDEKGMNIMQKEE